MGTTQYLVLLSEHPEYNSKIRGGFLLGPTAFGGNASNPMVVLAEQAENIQSIFEWIGMHEFMPNYLEFKSWLAHSACTISDLHMEACRSFYAVFVGMHKQALNITMVPTYLSHTPAGSSLKQFTHFAQQFRNGGRFARFDYGHVQNLMTYGSLDPPEYRVENIWAPTAMFVGDADGFADPLDANLLAGKLQNVILNEVVDYENWSHLGYIWSLDAKPLIYDKILKLMKEMT